MNPTKHHLNFTSEEISNFLKIAGSICIGVLTLLLVVKTMSEIKSYSTIGENLANAIQNVISVTGKSDMDVKPDVTVFSWSIEAEGKTAEQAQSKSATINNKAIAFVKEKGIKEADIKTLGLNTYPKYSNISKGCPVRGDVQVMNSESGAGTNYIVAMPPCVNTESVIVGYTTSQSIQVKVRNVDTNSKLTGELIAGLASIGVQVSTPSSTVDDMDGYKRAVRDEAILKARQEAEVLAKALGVKLVKITSFNESGTGGYPYAMDYMSARAGAMEKAVVPDLPTGTNKISSEVTITYQIR